jgi:hypothetical protein
VTPLLWFLAGVLWLGLAIVIWLAFGRQASDADDEMDGERWVRDQLVVWERETAYYAELFPNDGPYDHETRLDFDRNERVRRENQ